MRSIYYSFGKCYLLALICVAGFSPEIDAIGIASLQVPSESLCSDAALQASQASEVDAIGIASLQPLNPVALDADWQILIDQMHSVERVAAPFVEERTFAFRKKPKQYRGVFRKEADGRVSLAYAEPEAIALHLGDDFAYYRKGEGTMRRIPQSDSEVEALALFPKLLNFNLVSIAEFYAISGVLQDDAWQLAFDAKTESEEVLPYQHMRITGLGIEVQRIVLSKSEKQQVVIEMGDPVYPDFYLPQIKAAYFFRPESNE